MYHILSIDPGGESGKNGETGIAWGRFSDTEGYALEDYWAIPAGVAAFKEWEIPHGYLFDRFDYVVCEDFIQWNKLSDPSPLRLIGAVQYIWPDVILRPAGKRTIVSVEALKENGMYVAGGNHRDVTEAIRHGISWLMKDMGHAPTQRKFLK